MAGYVIADVEVTDAALFDEYRKLVPATIEAYGGRYLVRGGEAQLVEGDRPPNRTVVLQFDSLESAREWYNSEEYAGPKEMRMRSTNSSMIIVDGI